MNAWPFKRIVFDARFVVVPLALLALANLVMIGLVLGPLASRVHTLEARAASAMQAAATAQRDLTQARALATGKTQAAIDLERFYHDVLPVDQPSARRLTYVRLADVARNAGLDFDRRAFTQDRPKDARLVRADLAMAVRGRYRNLRQFFEAVETGDDFVVIRSVSVGQVAENPGLLEAVLGLSTFYKAPDGQ